MSKLNLLATCMVALGLAVGIVGCAGSPSKSGTSQSDAKGQQSDAKGQGGDAKAAKIAANLAKLSTADRAAAEKQKICPVTKAPLGSMGTPLPVDVGEGRIVFICCKGCRDTLLEDVDACLAVLAKHKQKPE